MQRTNINIFLACSLLVFAISTGKSDAAPSSNKTPSQAEEKEPAKTNDWILFSSNSLSYLYGFTWNTPFSASRFRDIVTVEHFHANRVGDVFAFVDIANLSTFGRGDPDAGLDIYGELSFRLSGSKLFGRSLTIGRISDVFAYSGTLEVGRFGSLENINDAFGTQIETSHFAHLHGMSVDLKIPRFQVASISLYWRDDIHLPGNTYHLSSVWALPFTLGGVNFSFGGFAELVGPEGQKLYSVHSSPQFLINGISEISSILSSVQFGVEVDVWINEFGSEGNHDFVPQLMAKASF